MPLSIEKQQMWTQGAQRGSVTCESGKIIAEAQNKRKESSKTAEAVSNVGNPSTQSSSNSSSSPLKALFGPIAPSTVPFLKAATILIGLHAKWLIELACQLMLTLLSSA